MEARTKRELTAPCGLDCFNCEIYEGNITDALKATMAQKLGRSPDRIACKGCRAQDGCSVFEGCKTLACVKEKGVEFCFECDAFPCLRLCPAKEGADRFPHNFKLFNLCRMKAVGVDRWAEEEAADIRRRYFAGTFWPGSGPTLEP